VKAARNDLHAYQQLTLQRKSGQAQPSSAIFQTRFFARARRPEAEILGKGGHAIVFKVFLEDKPYVLKIYNSGETKHLRYETEAYQELHDNGCDGVAAPRYLGCSPIPMDWLKHAPFGRCWQGDEDLHHGILLDYMEGCTLQEFMRTDHVLTADHREDVERVCETLARNLETLHQNGLTHNSIKAENMFVEMKDGRPQRGLLLDLGRAKFGDCHWMRRAKRDETELHQILYELREKKLTAHENEGPFDVVGAR